MAQKLAALSCCVESTVQRNFCRWPMGPITLRLTGVARVRDRFQCQQHTGDWITAFGLLLGHFSQEFRLAQQGFVLGLFSPNSLDLGAIRALNSQFRLLLGSFGLPTRFLLSHKPNDCADAGCQSEDQCDDRRKTSALGQPAGCRFSLACRSGFDLQPFALWFARPQQA